MCMKWLCFGGLVCPGRDMSQPVPSGMLYRSVLLQSVISSGEKCFAHLVLLIGVHYSVFMRESLMMDN